jgi:hypothetical protein
VAALESVVSSQRPLVWEAKLCRTSRRFPQRIAWESRRRRQVKNERLHKLRCLRKLFNTALKWLGTCKYLGGSESKVVIDGKVILNRVKRTSHSIFDTGDKTADSVTRLKLFNDAVLDARLCRCYIARGSWTAVGQLGFANSTEQSPSWEADSHSTGH